MINSNNHQDEIDELMLKLKEYKDLINNLSEGSIQKKIRNKFIGIFEG